MYLQADSKQIIKHRYYKINLDLTLTLLLLMLFLLFLFFLASNWVWTLKIWYSGNKHNSLRHICKL